MERFIICRASAGSGKTYTLVRQFIEAAISSPADLEHGFERILAITFTNKAANGMKQRIMSQLHDIAAGGSIQLAQEMAEHLSVDVEEIVRRCSVLQSSILHHYSNLSVCTIDSFVHRLVRTFAHDLRLPMNFNVQIDEQEMLQWSVDELLSAAGKAGEESLTNVLCSFVESRMEEGSGYKVDRKLMNLAQQILKEETPQFLSRLDEMEMDDFVEAFRNLHKENRNFESKVAAAAQVFVDACNSEGLDVDDFPNKKSGIYPFFKRLVKGDVSSLNGEHKRVNAAGESGILYAKSTPADTRQKLESVTPAFMKAYALIDELSDKELVKYNTRNLLLPNVFGLALLGRINKLKNEYYHENDTVHISEFNKRVAEEIADEPAPFIYERIGSRYNNYLIDEFQDTSRLQWLNFLPLLDEAMSRRPSANTAAPGLQSLVVGDGKQAIYRFRQGDVRQFMRLPDVEDPMHGKTLKYNAKAINLDRNFRTLSNIVEFNNRFFKHIVTHQFADNQELNKLYIGEGGLERPDLEQRPVKKGGLVRVAFCDKEEMSGNILNAIRHEVDEFGYGFGDIMILARKNKTLVEIANYIVANSTDRPIPLISAESFILSNSKVVLLLISVMQYIYDPKNRVACINVLQEMSQIGLTSADNESRDKALWALKECDFRLQDILETYGIELNIDYLRSLSLYDCCEQLLRSFHLEGRDTAYVSTLLNAVGNFEQRNHSGLSGLLDYLKANIDKLSCSTVSDMDAVQLMTIHKAKGLEGKIVIVAMPSEKAHNAQLWVNVPKEEVSGLPVAFVNSKKETTLFDDLFEEERRMSEMDRINVLYVALTRAEEKLLVYCEEKFSSEGLDNNSLLYDFVSNDSACAERGDRIFEIGEDDARKEPHNQETDSNAIVVDNAVFPEWQDRIGIAAKGEALLSSVMADNRRYGVLLHEILSLVDSRDDLEAVVTGYCRQNGYDGEVKDAVLKRLSDMMDKEENARFFDGRYKSIREVSMVVDGTVLRPDRVVFAGDKTWVVDFKTGVFNEDKHRQYEMQVNSYCTAIAAMGYPSVTPVIIYL